MSKDNVYVLGSINSDIMISSNRIPEQGETIAGFDFFQSIGGKGGNQASAVSKLGAETFMIGCVGRDYHGQLALNALLDAGVDTTHVEISETEYTGTAVILNVDNDNRIIINQGANGAINSKQLNHALINANHSIFLTQLEVPLNTVYEGLVIAKKKEMITVVNPAPAMKIDSEYYALVDYLILNETECKTLTGIEPSNEENVKKIGQLFMDLGVKHVILTLGGEGNCYIDDSTIQYVEPYRVEVIDTTGAGDAYIGAFIFGLSQGFEVNKMLEYASASGALACTKKGAQTSIPTLIELENMVKKRRKKYE